MKFNSLVALLALLSIVSTFSALAAEKVQTVNANSGSDIKVIETGSDSRNYVEFVRQGEETRFNLGLGPFAYGASGKYGLLAGASIEFWNLEKNYIQAINVSAIKSSDTTINISGAFYYEALPRIYAGPALGINYRESSGFGALSLRLLGADPGAQKFFSMLYTQIDLGMRSTALPYGSLQFGLQLF